MNAKEYLSRYIQLGREIAAKEAEIKELQDKLYSLPSALKEAPVMGGGGSDRLANLLSNIIDKQKEIKADVRHLMRIREEIENTINAVTDCDQRTVLIYRYLCGVSYEDIAQYMSYSLRKIHYLHGQALQAVKLPQKKEA